MWLGLRASSSSSKPCTSPDELEKDDRNIHGFFGFLKSLRREKHRHFKEEHGNAYTLIRHHTFTFINLGQINLVSSKNPSSAPKVLQVFQVSNIFTGQAQQPAQNLSNFHPKLLRNVCYMPFFLAGGFPPMSEISFQFSTFRLLPHGWSLNAFFKLPLVHLPLVCRAHRLHKFTADQMSGQKRLQMSFQLPNSKIEIFKRKHPKGLQAKANR